MSDKQPRISSLKPVVLKDNRRVTLELTVDNLPAGSESNVMLMPDILDTPPAEPSRPVPGGASPFPHVELSILDSRRHQVASLLIVEHKETHTALTLHLPASAGPEQYIARAEISHNQEIIDVVEVPFTLKSSI